MSPASDPSPTNVLSSASFPWVVGSRSSPFENVDSGLALHFNGTTWANRALPMPSVPEAATKHASRLLYR